MEPVEQFADTLDSLLQFSQLVHELSLEERVHQTRAWFALLYQNGAALTWSHTPSPLSVQPISRWPTYGRFDEFWALTNPHGHEPPELRSLPSELAEITDDLATGLGAYYDGRNEDALCHWGRGFEERYGHRILAILAALHHAVQHFEKNTIVPVKPRSTATIVMLDDTAAVKPGVMGLRLHPTEGGALIVGVHPRGPAQGILEVDDLILAVDDAPLQGESPKELGMALSGPREQDRILTIFRAGETYQIPIAPVDPARLTGEVSLTLLVPDAARHAAQALEVLGCTVHFTTDSLRIIPSAHVDPADLDVLVAAGENNQIWIRKE